MKAIRAAAVAHPNVQEALIDSLVCSFQRLKLKDEPFSVFTFATSSQIDTLASFLAQIQPGIDPSCCAKSDIDSLPVLKQFLVAKQGIITRFAF